MNLLAPFVLCALVGADPVENAENLTIVYDGRFTPVAVAEGKASPKGFSVTWFLDRPSDPSDEGLFLVAEDASALPWPARFGFLAIDNVEDGPRIGYRFGDRDSVVPLPGVRFQYADRLEDSSDFRDGRVSVAVQNESKDVAGHDCRIVSIDGGPTHRQTIAVERATGFIIRFESDVFLGQGDRFHLTLELARREPLADRAAAWKEIATVLRKIADAMEDADRESGRDLPAAALVVVAKHQAALQKIATGTPFESLAQAISRSVAEQELRTAGVDKLSQDAVGKPAPAFKQQAIDGRAVDSESFKNKAVVLHFWDYDNEQLTTPYGQVGYLDHLYRQRAGKGVEIIGVAVDPRFGDAKARPAAVRSAKKLVEFMNITYPVVTDDGTLLKSVGDPRTLGASLPLWVVIGPDGIVRTYKSGFYELKANEGLKELDANVVELAK